MGPSDVKFPSGTRFTPTQTVVLLIVFLALFLIGFLFYQNQQSQAELARVKRLQQTMSEDEANTLVVEVGKLIQLPKEEPTIADVTDVTKLQSQAFFAHARNGDKVLIFAHTKKLILYRPSERKIIEVSSVREQEAAILTPTPAR
jgi:hypothetical protein